MSGRLHGGGRPGVHDPASGWAGRRGQLGGDSLFVSARRLRCWAWSAPRRYIGASSTSRTGVPHRHRRGQNLMATKTGEVTGKRLFGSMGLAGLWCVARDALGMMPSLVAQLPIPGVSFRDLQLPADALRGLPRGQLRGGVLNLGALVGNFAASSWAAARRPLGRDHGAGHHVQPGHGPHDGLRRGRRAEDILPHAARLLLRARGARWREEPARSPRGSARSPLMVAAAALLVCIGSRAGPGRRRGRGPSRLRDHDREPRSPWARPASTRWRSSASSCFSPWRRSLTRARCSSSTWRAWWPWLRPGR